MAMPATDHVIAALYAAAVDPEQWNSALESVAGLADGRAAVFLVQDLVTDRLLEHRFTGLDSPRWANDYARHYHALDLARQVLQREPAGSMYPMHRYVSDKVVDRSEYYQDFYLRTGMRYSCGGTSFDDGRRLILAVHRPLGHRPFENETVASLQRVLEHLPNVFRVRRLANRAREDACLSTAALEALPRPVVIVDGLARIRYLNPAARLLLDESADVRARVGRLSMRDPALERELSGRIRDACRTPPSVNPAPFNSVDSGGRPAVAVTVVPLRPEHAESFLYAEPMALILLRRPFIVPQWPRGAPRPYGLTRAELSLATALVEGLTPAEHAERIGVKISTVRSQIQAVLAKTGTRRATEIAALFATLVC